MRVGNKINSYLNGEWGKHAKPFFKKLAASRRRQEGKEIIRQNASGSE
jgi:hypothetical protein